MPRFLSALDARVADVVQRAHVPTLSTLGVALAAIGGYAYEHPDEWHRNRLQFAIGAYLAWRLAKSQQAIAPADGVVVPADSDAPPASLSASAAPAAPVVVVPPVAAPIVPPIAAPVVAASAFPATPTLVTGA